MLRRERISPRLALPPPHSSDHTCTHSVDRRPYPATHLGINSPAPLPDSPCKTVQRFLGSAQSISNPPAWSWLGSVWVPLSSAQLPKPVSLSLILLYLVALLSGLYFAHYRKVQYKSKQIYYNNKD